MGPIDEDNDPIRVVDGIGVDIPGISVGPDIFRASHNTFSGMGTSWGPQGLEYARFHLAGDLNVRILLPSPGNKDLNMEVLSGCDWGDGNDTRTSTVLRLPKARARALASAIMGAAAEI